MEQTTQISLSESAAKRVAFLLAKEPEGSLLRVAVDGGGCAGFQYSFAFVAPSDITDGDLLIEKDGAKVAIDDVSLDLMSDSVIDYVETLGAAHFEIKNPQASSSCGCGNSFSV